MLTTQEKQLIREIICSGVVTPSILESYAKKSDEEVRVLIAEYKVKLNDYLNKQIANLQAKQNGLK